MIIERTVAAVIIGRNEGERLKRCIQSLKQTVSQIVYVDSGSIDNSVNFAKSSNVIVVELDLSVPFTAARARNSGAQVLLENFPEVDFIQFIDGDCEVQPRWVESAAEFLRQHNSYAVVCGRRRERYPDASVYNLLCDIEWDTPIGDATACGGDALIRVEAFKTVEGYCDDLIAGEEPEMCFRMRQLGWKVMRLDKEMTLHDAAMTKLSQWWKRHKRAGHAYAESFDLHGRSAEQFRRAECIRIILWGGLLPILIVGMTLYSFPFILGTLLYLAQVVRLTARYRASFHSWKPAFIYAMSNVFSKFPQASGLLRYHLNKAMNKRNSIIEYK